MRPRVLVLFWLSAVLASACAGSTASKKGAARPEAAAEASAAPAEAIAGTTAVPDAAPAASAGAKAASKAKSATSAKTGAAPGAGGTTSAGTTKIPGSGKGYTDNEIKVGFQLVTDTEAAFKAVGAGSGPNEQAIADRVIDWVNKNGGIAGRKVAPVFHLTESLNGTWAAQAEAACKTFTEDNKVVGAITSATGGSDAVWACMSKKGTPLIERNIWLWDDRYYTERPDMLYTPSKMSPDRWIGHWLDGLKEIGFFNGATVGLLKLSGEPFDRLYKNRLRPKVDGMKVPLKEDNVITITSPPSISAYSNMSAEIGNAIVKLRQNNVTHLIFLQNSGALPFFFMPAAEAQRYYPKYGLSSADIPLTLNGLAPQTQLENGVGVSWTPPNDVAHQAGPDPGRLQREAACKAINGTPGFHNGSMCDALLFLKHSLDRAAALDPSGFSASVRKTADGYQSAMSVENFFDGSRFFDGASGVRYFNWKFPCAKNPDTGQDVGCFRFTTGGKQTRR